MKKNIITLVCIFICFTVGSALAQNSLTPTAPNISPNSYIETPEYSEEYVSSLLERIVNLEVLASSLEARVVELERYLNAYTASSAANTVITQQPTTQQPATQQAAAQQADTQQATTQQPAAQQAATQQALPQQESSTSASTDYSTNPDADSYSYYLQVGAYQRSDLGFQQKQKLEQYGYAVQESANENIYRLYIGPFPNSEIDGIQAQLRELGIDSFPIR